MTSRLVPRTLRSRLSLAALAATAVGVLLVTAAFDALLAHRLQGESDSLLRTRARDALALVVVAPDGHLGVTDNTADAALDSGIWVYQGRTALERPPGSAHLQQGADALAGTARRLVREDDPEPVAWYSEPVLLGERQVGTVVAAVPLGPYRSTFRTTLVGSALLGLLLLALVWVVTRATVARALRPVAQMTAQAREWSVTDTTQRFGDQPRPGELAELGMRLDQLLERTAAVLRREQQLSAEVSHELRTPLAGVLAEVELFRSRPRSLGEAAAAMDAVEVGARRLERVLESLLAAARLGAAGQALGRSPARPAVDAAVEDLQAARPGAHVEVVEEVPGLVVGVEQAVVERVLGPLLDNACRYARSEVHVRLATRGSGVRLEVSDDGPGVPADAREEVFEPGRRLQPQDGHDGAGLGLALARRLAEAAGGSLVLEGGSTFVATLPRG